MVLRKFYSDLGVSGGKPQDKTGTLTCNGMDFRKFCVKGITYGQARF